MDKHEGTWSHVCSHSRVDVNDPAAMVEAHQPCINLNIYDVNRINLGLGNQLNEYTYRDLAQLIDGSFLSQKLRADELKRVEYDYIDQDGIIHFLVPSSEYASNGIKYRNMVMFDDWDEVGQDESYRDVNEKARILLWQGNIRLHCTCPSFIYWGYQWLLTVLDSSVYPETREPRIRNPKHRGIVCKHLNRVLRVLPFYSGRIAGAMKQQFG